MSDKENQKVKSEQNLRNIHIGKLLLDLHRRIDLKKKKKSRS